MLAWVSDFNIVFYEGGETKIVKERQPVSNKNRRSTEIAEIFNPGNQSVVKLNKEAQGTMHYKAQK